MQNYLVQGVTVSFPVYPPFSSLVSPLFSKPSQLYILRIRVLSELRIVLLEPKSKMSMPLSCKMYIMYLDLKLKHIIRPGSCTTSELQLNSLVLHLQYYMILPYRAGSCSIVDVGQVNSAAIHLLYMILVL